MTILWLTDTFSIIWLTDTFYLVFIDPQTHLLFCDFQTLLENVKAGATAKYLWAIRLYTVDPVGAKPINRSSLEKNIILNHIQEDYCDYFMTYRQVMLG